LQVNPSKVFDIDEKQLVHHLLHLRDVHLGNSMEFLPEYVERLSEWFQKRAEEIEEHSGLIDNALEFLEISAKLGIPDLDELVTSMKHFGALVYKCGRVRSLGRKRRMMLMMVMMLMLMLMMVMMLMVMMVMMMMVMMIIMIWVG
jgi:hypothetical protein